MLKYYNSYKAISQKDLPKIIKSKGKWICDNGLATKDLPLDFPYDGWDLKVFDEKNYYLELEITGDIAVNNYNYTMAVYLSQDRNNVFAVSETRGNSEDNENIEKKYDFAFYRFDGNTLKDVTNVVIPKIKLEMFFPKNFKFSALDKMNEYLIKRFADNETEIIKIFCLIPHQGTLTKFIIEITSSFYNEDEKVKKAIDDGRKSIVKKEILFNWNSKKGIFEGE